MSAHRTYPRALGAADLLDAWEAGSGRSPVVRALALLVAAHPESTPAALEQLTVGERDARLLALWESTFGDWIAGLVDCPACAEAVEIRFRAADVRVAAPDATDALRADVGAVAVDFRLPDSRDLAAALAGGDDVGGVRRALLERCIVRVVGAEAGQLDDAVVDAIAARMSAADPQANVDLALSCPACGHAWDAPLDIASYLWLHVDARAQRTLHDVHALARAYGWSEDAILALTPARRQAYLDLIDT